MTTDKFRFLLYGGGLQNCEQLMWELQDLGVAPQSFTNIYLGRWILEESPMTPLSPSTFETSVLSVHFIEDVLFVLVATNTEEWELQLWKLQLWHLHLTQ